MKNLPLIKKTKTHIVIKIPFGLLENQAKEPDLKTLYGIWEGVKVNEADFQGAKDSLFQSLK